MFFVILVATPPPPPIYPHVPVRLFKHPLHDDPKLEELYDLCEKKNALAIKCKDIKQELRDARTGNIMIESKTFMKN